MHTVDTVMTTNVRTVRTTDVVATVRDLMLDQRIHSVPVLDTAGALAGIVTSSDLVEEWAPDMGVETVMSRDVQTTGRHRTITDAARQMVDHRVHHLVVVERDTVVGVVSSYDMLAYLAGRVEQAESAGGTSMLTAAVGDVIVVRGTHMGDRDRRALVVEVRGDGGQPPYLVKWITGGDDREHLFFPGSDAYVEPRSGR